MDLKQHEVASLVSKKKRGGILFNYVQIQAVFFLSVKASLTTMFPPSSASLVTPSSSPSVGSHSSTLSTPRDVVTAARNDLRSMSQRLERLLRERREATERRPARGAEESEQLRDLERRTLDILDRRLGRGASVRPQSTGLGGALGDALGLTPTLTDSSPSDSEEEGRGEEGLFPRAAGSRIPVR